MARAGMARWRPKSPANGEGDEVQRSLELLDRVLSEFDDLENGNVQQHDSPTLGHQSEDDGYMSMNGRRSKCSPDEELPEPLPPLAPVDCPPPPEEAQRVISTLLPRVSPCSSMQRGSERCLPSAESLGHWVHTATQTTLPKTRHQRPYGWQTGAGQRNEPSPQLRFASLPCSSVSRWLPQSSSGVERTFPPRDELADFSDDSLEEQPRATTRSVSWEVPLLEPGSTQVVGRRRRSTDHSSTGSIHKPKETEEWPDPPQSEMESTFSDAFYDSSITNDEEENCLLPAKLYNKQMSQGGTYVIRKGRKKERKSLPKTEMLQYEQNPHLSDLKRCSSTFDNIKSLLKEGLLEGLDEPPPDFLPPAPPSLGRVLSLPMLVGCDVPDSSASYFRDAHHRSKTDLHRLSRTHELAVTVEEEEGSSYCYNSEDCNGLDDRLSDLRVSEEERKLIAQLERENSGQFLDMSAESLLLGDGDFLGLRKRNDCSDRRSNCSSSSKTSSKEIFFNDTEFVPREQPRLSTDSLNLYRDVPRYSVSKKKRELGHSSEERLTGSQEALLEKVKWDAKSNKRPECLRSRSEEYAKMVDVSDVWLVAAELNHFDAVSVVEGDCRERAADLAMATDECDFPPLPPSPVEEDDEYSEILPPSPVQTPGDEADILPEPLYRSLEPPSANYTSRCCLPEPSLASLSMDTGFSRGLSSGSRREVPTERRTLPAELPGNRGCALSKRTPHTETMQTCCSLPDTPIFVRGCDVPRTPHRRAPDVPTCARTAPRPGGLAGRARTALTGAELLRLAGGPGRGWYPRHRQPRPVSIEHLDHLPWEARDPRKPLTLPPNLSPRFFQRSPREALRRVTSLLIRRAPDTDWLGGTSCRASGSSPRAPRHRPTRCPGCHTAASPSSGGEYVGKQLNTCICCCN
ncbi:uncharacterized protein LOC134535708 isoform X2 [Bacillus rossius redtenbacheri]|uniref:uncharacterized protein LOC134535708 isoform X2 n=1 Tax=Bacillus rossius redtenbacheri TaxID=93214 RepID=UPI002FDD3233